MLVGKGIGWYRSRKAQPQTKRQPIAPLTTRALFAIILLAVTAILFVLYATPLFAPENIFARTESNPGVTTNLLFKRLAQARNLTAYDDLLRDKFESKASKMLYFKYGPDVLATCPFCNSQDPTTYLLFAAPAVALVHLANAVIVGIATSEPLAGAAGVQWRGVATWAAVTLLAVDAYLLASWDPAGNEGARVLRDVSFLHWTMRLGRLLAFAVLDAALAAMLFLSATRRMFVVPPTVSERIDAATAAVAAVHMRVRSANVLKNTIARDPELRAVDAAHWAEETATMQEAMESEEVVSSMRDALDNGRLDPQGVDTAADEFSHRVLGM